MTSARSLALLAATLILGACADGDTDDTAGDVTTTTSADVAETCVAPTFTVERPEGWEVNDPEDAPPCRWFDPEPVEVPENTEAVGIAIHIGYQEVTFERATNPSPELEEEIDRREEQVDGRNAVRLHLRSTGQALLDAGAEVVTWVIDAGPHRSFIAGTFETDEEFASHVEALDGLVGSLDFSVDQACSAVESRLGSPQGQPELPVPTAEMRQAIAEAALACDYDRLAELAGSETPFTYSFGGGDDFAGFLQQGEAAGEDPLLKLVQILNLTHAELTVDDEEVRAWPAAFTYESWNAVPEPLKEELRPVYGPEGLENFDRAGAYLGYRTAISATGDWLYFVAGD